MNILQMSEEERKAVREANPPVVSGLHSTNLYFDWGWKGCGFGQLSVHFDKDTGDLTCMNECMGRESVRKLLHAYADFLADRVVLSDSHSHEIVDVPPIDIKKEMEEQRIAYDAYLAEQGTTREELFGPE